MKIKGAIVFAIVVFLLGIIFTIYFSGPNSKFQKELIELVYENSFEIDVIEAYNEHGIYILNDKYFLNSGSKIVQNNGLLIKDPALWRPPNKNFIPYISNISPPFQITKKQNSDTINMIKDGKSLIVILKK